jgi:hypothetical protein
MKKGVLAVVLAAGLMVIGCGGTSGTQKTALAPAPATIIAGSPGSDSAEGLAGAPVLGTTYQMEAALGFDFMNEDPPDVDITSINLGFTYYWKPVNNDDTPVGLQEFMQKATKASIDLWFISPDGGQDETAWELAGNYAVAEDGRLIAEAALNGKFGFGDMVLAGNDWFGIRLGAKYYILDTLTVGLAYSVSRDSDADTTVDEVIISGEYAVQLGGRWLDAGLSIHRFNFEGANTTTIDIDLTYYILKELGVNVMYAGTGGDGEANTFGIGAKYYYGPFAFGLMYRQFNGIPNPDISDFGLNVEFRF